MFAVRKILTPWRALIATVVICATAPPARADLFLTITNNNGPGSTTIDLGNSGGSGTTTVAGYSFAYDVTSSPNTASNHSASIGLDLTVTSTKTGTGNFTVDLFSATNSSGNTSSGVFTPGVGSTGSSLQLTNSSSIKSLTASSGSLTTSGDYTAYNGNTTGGIDSETTGTTSFSNTKGQTSTGTSNASFSQVSGTSSFDLSADSSTVSITGKGKIEVTSKTTVTTNVATVPEPSGVAAAMAGLPCLGLLVGFARRRRLQVNPVSAA